MNRTIRLLAALLGVQVLLALGLSFWRSDVAAHVDPKPLLSFAKDQVTRMTLEGPDQAKLELAKVDGKWQLAGADAFPADAGKVEQLLTRLADLKHGAPVATSSGAFERFKVNDKAYERRITLAAGDKSLPTIYLGTSPGMRAIHARTSDQSDVFSVSLASYDVPVRRDDWEDKTVLQVPRDRIAAIEANGVRVERENGKFSEGADRLADLVGQLRYDRALGRDDKPEYNLKSPALTLAVTRDDGTRIEYRIGKTKDDYVLKASTRPEYFRLPSYTATPIIEAADRNKLAGAKTESATAKS